MKFYNLLFFFFFITSSLFSEKYFFFKFDPEDIFIIEKKQFIKENNYEREEKNKIHLVVKEVREDGFLLEGNFITFSRNPSKEISFRKLDSYFSSFVLKKNGEYIVDKKFIYPNYHSVPTFPINQNSLLKEWNANAKEIIYLEEIDKKIEIPFTVKYSYKGEEEINYFGKIEKTDKIEYKYNFKNIVELNSQNINLESIIGDAKGIIWFSQEKGIPLKDEQFLNYQFVLKNNNTFHESFHIQSLYKKLKKLDKKIVVQKLNQIHDKNIKIKETDNGVSIEINQILFDFDSYKLREDTKKVLDQIYEILKQYPDREIEISGHTDNIGSEKYNLKLSEKRAEEVSKYLIHKGIDENQISHKGYGSSKPVAPNDTPQNREKNRRVEILIVTD